MKKKEKVKCAICRKPLQETNQQAVGLPKVILNDLDKLTKWQKVSEQNLTKNSRFCTFHFDDSLLSSAKKQPRFINVLDKNLFPTKRLGKFVIIELDKDP